MANMLDVIAEVPCVERDAAIDAYNAKWSTIASFSAGLGDAAWFWCPGCGQNFRQSWGIGGDEDRWAYAWGSVTGIVGSVVAPHPTSASPAPEPTSGPAGSPNETAYRTMSPENYAELEATGNLPGTRETFISPSRSFASKYEGVLVKFELEPGTFDRLSEIGVRAHGERSQLLLPDLPLVRRGWGYGWALFKPEGDVINIGLGYTGGAALARFNNGILSFEVITGP